MITGELKNRIGGLLGVFAAFIEQTDKSKLEIQKSLEKLETLEKH